eukprot:CAMPEP_0183792824 /NCGR_PEP_ID=MMETSP0803_2-20130417/2824_1 /TAXON_ID=195967 /ORGANISM="Crustomastix stigmata, Strain CCMP3273" /LENGTH=186 /DNA_ID=CAMNT_0026037193 /DNA_START=57 /DNA_END=614 /DNA_ORIENTATION=+
MAVSASRGLAAGARCVRRRARARGGASAPHTTRRRVTVAAEGGDGSPALSEEELSRQVKKIGEKFAPGASKKTKNPAVKGTALYTIFEVQAYLAIVVGALLSFNVIFPSDEPDIARLMGMWSLWMFTIPSLRARDCDPKEKDALNVLFLLVPLINVLLPFVWKSFAFIFSADCVACAGVYYWKGAG